MLGLLFRAAVAIAKAARNPAVRRSVIAASKKVAEKSKAAVRWVVQKCSKYTPKAISPQKAQHILRGDKTGGGHLWPGKPGKSPFPKNWSDSKILREIDDIAANPKIPSRVQSNGRIVKDATVDGVDVRVIMEPSTRGGGVVTGFPTNLPRNPI